LGAIADIWLLFRNIVGRGGSESCDVVALIYLLFVIIWRTIFYVSFWPGRGFVGMVCHGRMVQAHIMGIINDK
jgi:hypothetical protein